MKYERIKNTKRNLISASAFKVVSLVMPVIIRAIIIRSLGAEYVGISGLFSSILTVLSISELGFGSAIVFSMYEPIARDDFIKVGALLNFYKKIYKWVTLIIVTGGIVSSFFLQYLIKGEYPQELNIYYLFILYLINTASSYMFGAYKASLLTAYQRDDVISKCSLASQIIVYATEVIILVFFRNYYGYVIVMSLGNVILNLSISRYVDNNYPNIRIQGEITGKERGEIINKVKGLLANRILSVSRTSSDTIFITSFCGLLSNAIYSNYFLVVTSINSLMFLLAASITGGIGNGLIVYDEDKNYNDFMSIDIIFMAVCSIWIIGMFNFYDIFISTLFGSQYILGQVEKMLFCSLFFVISTGNIKGIYLNAAGLWDKTKKYAIMDAICNALLNLIGVLLFGISGVVSATIITLLVFDSYIYTKVLFDEVLTEHRLVSFWKLNAFFALSIVFVLQAGRVVSCFCENEYLVAILSFVFEIVAFGMIILVTSRYNKYFKDSFRLVNSLIRLR